MRNVVLLAWVLASMPAPAADRQGDLPGVALASVWRDGFDVRDYLVSEKYDGVRAMWDGVELRFRSGRRVPAPAWFVAPLPAVALDGELWLGRGRFDALSAIVRRDVPDDAWREVTYRVFDLPDATVPFEARVAGLVALMGTEEAPVVPWVRPVSQHRVATIAQLHEELRAIVAAGGEGLMLRRAVSLHRGGRSDDLLKLKPDDDAEARVVGYAAGKGRLAGRVGALVMEMPASMGGKRFRLAAGLTDAQRRHPPPIGTLVTYRYTSLTPRGVPRFPRFWRVREEF